MEIQVCVPEASKDQNSKHQGSEYERIIDQEVANQEDERSNSASSPSCFLD